MNKENRKYALFKNICGITHVTEKRLCEMISGQARFNHSFSILVHDKSAHLTYRLGVTETCVKDEFMVTLHEQGTKTDKSDKSDIKTSVAHKATDTTTGNHSTSQSIKEYPKKLIIKGYIKITKPKKAPKRKRLLAISTITGSIILLGIASVTGVGLSTTVFDILDEDNSRARLEISSIVFTVLADNIETRSVYADIDIVISPNLPVTINGDVEAITLDEGMGATITENNRGAHIKYSGSDHR